MLIEPNVYSEGALFRLVIQEEKTTIKLIEVVEHGMNFDRVRYVEVVEGEEDEVESTSASAPPRRSALPTSGSARTMPPPSTRTVPPAPRKTMPPGW